MASCLPGNTLLHDRDLSVDYDSDLDDEYEEFCEQFDFQNINTCWVCNGYYGPNFGEPLCGTCHAFLFPTTGNEEEENLRTLLSDDEDSGNDEPPYTEKDRSDRANRTDRAGNENSDEEDDDEDLVDDRIMYNNRPAPSPPRNLNHYLENLSAPVNGNVAAGIQPNIMALPVEVLIKIFSYLDDLSLWNVSEVCQRWRKILENHTAQSMWKKYTIERWPLLQNRITISNWFHMYSALMSSCFCRTCLLQMVLKTPIQARLNNFRATRLRGDVRSLDLDAGDDVDAVPLDAQWAHWQASILGPIGSPYEGGRFFLYIFIPSYYPMAPPTIRFLTKIVHPNVSRHGDVGIDIIQHNWSLALTISKLLISVQSLLTDPFTDICMEPELGRMYENDRPRFEALARRWTWKYAMTEIIPTN